VGPVLLQLEARVVPAACHPRRRGVGTPLRRNGGRRTPTPWLDPVIPAQAARARVQACSRTASLAAPPTAGSWLRSGGPRWQRWWRLQGGCPTTRRRLLGAGAGAAAASCCRRCCLLPCCLPPSWWRAPRPERPRSSEGRRRGGAWDAMRPEEGLRPRSRVVRRGFAPARLLPCPGLVLRGDPPVRSAASLLARRSAPVVTAISCAGGCWAWGAGVSAWQANRNVRDRARGADLAAVRAAALKLSAARLARFSGCRVKFALSARSCARLPGLSQHAWRRLRHPSTA